MSVRHTTCSRVCVCVLCLCPGRTTNRYWDSMMRGEIEKIMKICAKLEWMWATAIVSASLHCTMQHPSNERRWNITENTEMQCVVFYSPTQVSLSLPLSMCLNVNDFQSATERKELLKRMESSNSTVAIEEDTEKKKCKQNILCIYSCVVIKNQTGC